MTPDQESERRRLVAMGVDEERAGYAVRDPRYSVAIPGLPKRKLDLDPSDALTPADVDRINREDDDDGFTARKELDLYLLGAVNAGLPQRAADSIKEFVDRIVAEESQDVPSDARPRDLVVGQTYQVEELREMFPGAAFVGFDEGAEVGSVAQVVPEDHPRHPDPRCKECGEKLGDADRAEVYINADTLRANAGGQYVLVDDIPDSDFGPYLVHADPCSRAETGGRPTYELA